MNSNFKQNASGLNLDCFFAVTYTSSIDRHQKIPYQDNDLFLYTYAS